MQAQVVSLTSSVKRRFLSLVNRQEGTRAYREVLAAGQNVTDMLNLRLACLRTGVGHEPVRGECPTCARLVTAAELRYQGAIKELRAFAE